MTGKWHQHRNVTLLFGVYVSYGLGPLRAMTKCDSSVKYLQALNVIKANKTSPTALLFISLPQPHWPSSSRSMFPTSGPLHLLFLEHPSVLCQTSSFFSFRLHLKCHFLQEVIILSKVVPDIFYLFSPSTTTIILRCLMIILGLYVFLQSEHCCFVYIFTFYTILCCRPLCLTFHLGSGSEYLCLFSVHLICRS